LTGPPIHEATVDGSTPSGRPDAMFCGRGTGYATGEEAGSRRPHGTVIMESRRTVLGHPGHPMLVTFPLGLFVTAVILDLADLAGGGVSAWLGGELVDRAG
jgi:hypothetical protein